MGEHSINNNVNRDQFCLVKKNGVYTVGVGFIGWVLINMVSCSTAEYQVYNIQKRVPPRPWTVVCPVAIVPATAPMLKPPLRSSVLKRIDLEEGVRLRHWCSGVLRGG